MAQIINNTPQRVAITPDYLSLHNNTINLSELKEKHQNIVTKYPDCEIVYTGFTNNELNVIIDSLEPIYLGRMTDFGNLTINLKYDTNITGPMFFLSMCAASSDVGWHKISKKDVDRGLFNHIDELKDGMKLLYVEDTHFWTVHSTSGTKYRKDILLIKDGRAQNSVIAPYDTNGTLLKCRYCNTNDSEKWIKNLNLVRPYKPGPNNVCKLVKAQYQNNVLFENITIGFDQYPNSEDTIGEDACFKIENSTNISFKNVTIDGTYSTLSKYGYGIELNNVWNSRFENLNAFGHWGVFGNNNVNYAYLKNCHINRFDLHLYGKDIICESCTFKIYQKSQEDSTHRYNRFDGLYGILFYKNCTFNDFCPVRIDYEFKVFTGFDCIIEGGKINIGPNVKCLVSILRITDNDLSPRPETTGVSWPNIIMLGVTLKSLVSGQCPYSLFEILYQNGYTYSGDIDYITMITISNIYFNGYIYIKEFHTDVNAIYPINRNISGLHMIDGHQTPQQGSYVVFIH